MDLMDTFWKDAIWQQFGAAIDMLEHVYSVEDGLIKSMEIREPGRHR